MGKEIPTKISHINIIVHPTMQSDETRIVSHQNASQLPPEVRDDVTFPCIMTGGLGLSKSMLTLLMAQSLSEYLGARGQDEHGDGGE